MRRSGFTLIELLVVIVIVAILATLAISAFTPSDSDRVNSAARLLQSKIMLARSSATSDRAVRGIRFERDANDPRVCRSVSLIGSAGKHEMQIDDIRVETGDPSTHGDDYWRISGSFDRLHQRRLLTVGTHVEIPSGSGMWYVLTDREFDPTNGNLSIAGHYHNSRWGDDPANTQAGEYITKHQWDSVVGLIETVLVGIELAPTTVSAEPPMMLPVGTGIDLDASQVPQAWRTVTNNCDLLFDSTGATVGVNGLVHLYVTRLADIELTRGLFPDHPALGGSRPQPIVPANAPHCPEASPYVVTVLKNTGACYASDVDLLDANADFQADQPYMNARKGQQRN